ncbi:MAG: enoyl-CoA hydratase-related protein [Pseudomonadota bacterium]
MDLQNILLEKKGHVCLMTINHPPANSWNLATMLDFEKALDEVEKDGDIRVIILTGSGKLCFSAGFDISDAANSHITSPKGQELWMRVDRFEKPFIAAINGHALGGGCELALSCHFRLMTDNPKAGIGLTELNLGIIPGWGGTQRLARVVGRSKALEMILFSKRLTAPEALEIGLVNQIASPDKLLDAAMDLAQKLAERPPIAVACVLKAMSAGLYEGLPQGLETELRGSRAAGSSKDAIEGFTAFLEKRKPVFKGE